LRLDLLSLLMHHFVSFKLLWWVLRRSELLFAGQNFKFLLGYKVLRWVHLWT
jgi:hypothetical protein